MERRRGGGGLRELHKAARLGFWRAVEGGGFGLGFKGARAAAIYRGARPLGVRDMKAAAARGVAGSDSTGVRLRHEVGGDPDRWAPLCRWAAGGGGRDGLGRRKGKGNGPAMGFWAAGRKKEKEGEGDGLGRPG